MSNVFLPVLSLFGVNNIGIYIAKRGYHPRGGGIVHVEVGPTPSLKPIQLIKINPVRKIKGISFATKNIKYLLNMND